VFADGRSSTYGLKPPLSAASSQVLAVTVASSHRSLASSPRASIGFRIDAARSHRSAATGADEGVAARR